MKDGVTLRIVDDFVRRCQEFARKRQDPADLHDAASHPGFTNGLRDLVDAKSEQFRQMRPIFERPPFASIEVGTFKSVDDLERALRESGENISSRAQQMLHQSDFILASEPAKLDLYGFRTSDLYQHGCSMEGAFTMLGWLKALQLPHEAAAQYCLQYKRPLSMQQVAFYTKPLRDSQVLGTLFCAMLKDGYALTPWLDDISAHPESSCAPYVNWVYGRKHK